MYSGKESGGLRLVRLINTRSLEIARREMRNSDRMCLYGTGEYWTGFEHSAYFLSQLFPKAESFVINHPDYPFPIVGVSVSVKDFRRYMKANDAVLCREDYVEYKVPTLTQLEFGHWHTMKVNDFRKSSVDDSHRCRHRS